MKHVKNSAMKCALAMMGLMTLTAPVISTQNASMFVVMAEANEIETRDFIYEWRYKVIDGHFYKRLFNRTTGQWETDWILVQ